MTEETGFAELDMRGIQGGRTVVVPETIDYDLVEKVVVPLLEMDEDGEPMRIFVSTRGGEANVAMCLCDVIERLKSPTEMILLGEVCSAGMFIAMAGFRNKNVLTCAYPSTVGMIHGGSYGCEYQPMHTLLDDLEFECELSVDRWAWIGSHSNIPQHVLDSHERANLWMTAQTMKEYGIVDEIL